MKLPDIDRRQLLRWGISSSILATLPLSCIALEDEANQLLELVSDSKLPVYEKRTGTLAQAGFDTLSTLCSYVNQAWELGSDMPQYVERLRVDLEFKTKERPSYLTEYENAIELIDLAGSKADSIEQMWTSLLFASFDVERFPHTKLGRARRFVFSEIITHQIPLSDAFKSFGLWNYPGYFGGAYTDATSYRKSE